MCVSRGFGRDIGFIPIGERLFRKEVLGPKGGKPLRDKAMGAGVGTGGEWLQEQEKWNYLRKK
ncbi:hypothetical protein FKX85_20410 [Echinicola soli]|uniref:Uncharacterized protein n=1 Tax=Echinicola soli TaxID=2591634 RepID=A0A514CN66_9BACT|nr:hypothetical protein [Echinicola soli]QDH81265.1 hypothetical protein FKX85_20410 [Echinicola soli]